MTEVWPRPSFHIKKEPAFLFIATPPYSGSTALTQVLNSSPGTALLQHRGEGQWLIPGMCQADRWDPIKTIHWDSVRAVWLNRIELIIASRQQQGLDLVIEKSPPNLVRLNQLIQTFPNHSLMVFNRDPYANCSSILYRNYDAQNKSDEERIAIVSQLALDWLFRSSWLRRWIEELSPVYFNYERFCAEPAVCVSELAVNIPSLRAVDVTRHIKVKDYEAQGLVNFNEKQLSKLRQKELDAISWVLNTERALVSFFGYEVL